MRAVSGAKKAISDGLNRAEALGVGDGKLDLGLLADYRSSEKAAVLGGYADYTHRLSEKVSAFVRAEAGRVVKRGPDYNFARGLAGLRFRF